jgi:limonene-1,2-epoxide hydrolase
MLHQELIEHFYHSLKNKDAEGMISCYHDDVVFTDPAFGTLKATDAKNMWRMLMLKGKSLEIDYSNIAADADSGTAHWTATYIFSKTNRKVVNNIVGTFEFKDGKIIRHTDTFDLRIWAKQAFGSKSNLFFFLGMLKPYIQRKSKEALHAFSQKNK